MNKIQDFLYGAEISDASPIARTLNPLLVTDLFREAEIIDVRIDALMGTAGVILERRTDLGNWRGDTGVILAHNVNNVSWRGLAFPGPSPHWIELSTVRAREDDGLLELELRPGNVGNISLLLLSPTITFISGTVPDFANESPPSYELTRLDLQGKVPSWDSPFIPLEFCSRSTKVINSSRSFRTSASTS